MPSAADIKKSVRDMYMAHPFPQLTHEERHRVLPVQLCRFKFLGLDQAMRGARVLDVGVGTGQKVLVPKYLGVREYIGFDQSTASLHIAARTAREEGFEHFTPVEGDLFNLPFPDNSFDVVISWGVLHVTSDPVRGLREIVRVCRPGGFVGIFLYNKWKHWRHNLRKNKVDRMAGPNFEDRFRVAHRLYGSKPVEEMTPGEIVVFYDRYCVPFKSDHTYGETLRWFDELGLEYWGSTPPLGFRDFLRYLQQLRGILADRARSPNASTLARTAAKAARLAGKLPSLGEPAMPLRRPGLLHRFFWQTLLVWQGRHGHESHSASFSARKPMDWKDKSPRRDGRGLVGMTEAQRGRMAQTSC